MNIYTEALRNVSCLMELTPDDFESPASNTANIVFEKGAVIYKVYGTKIAMMTHSDLFKTTPNQISWYEVLSVNADDARISSINVIDGDIEEVLSEEAYGEIMFFVNAARGNV